ncbi:hypothetical protein TVAG_462580 [Trichomonas vaginalis G3]|uniref:Nucleoplasmin-like domain-containing protein n=1 Tax=Trichomonas vaginalis (strain ATCC PRA-98 / G3) TaxID=412133 RepID=A2DLW9_TRIV3|nr:nucleoplasmin core domain domain-containing protein [Trichomonas vaginalis G3]EAY18572.1 hypothetical protein TVAG_462580 [Trichomonas vaginalis G3]KAI5491599.1 nucleoplasmin core domain domain-containing protein [Trichomonas vaginalis G3]|eukprot:XP_001579558.1 hypothetical protein [Trichomonas vaginalis G3]
METIVVPHGKKIKVTVPTDEETTLVINGASISVKKEIPAKGRVVLYMSSIENGKPGSEIAIAPFTIGKSETCKLDFLFEAGNQFILSTKGDNVDGVVHTYIPNFEKLEIETLD